MFADIIRGLAVSMIGLSSGLATYILVLYIRRMKMPPPPGRLLPIHVVLNSASHIILLLAYGYEVSTHFGEPFSFRAPLALLAGSLTFGALVTIGTFMARDRTPTRKDNR